MMIVLCQHRAIWTNSWMGSRGLDQTDWSKQYVWALYFVTTTVSTCGFGDIYAMKGDALESFVILML